MEATKCICFDMSQPIYATCPVHCDPRMKFDTFRRCNGNERTIVTSRGVYRLTEKSLKRIMRIGWHVTNTSCYDDEKGIKVIHNEWIL